MTHREHEGTLGWRAGIEACIRHVKTMQLKPRDLWLPAYFAALDEMLVRLEAMLERGTESAKTPVESNEWWTPRRYFAILPRDQKSLPGGRLVIERQAGENIIELREETTLPERVAMENAHRVEVREVIYTDPEQAVWVIYRLREALGL